jgi:hypothetical protein
MSVNLNDDENLTATLRPPTQREIQNMRLREIKAKRKADGLCTSCTKPTHSSKRLCQSCADKEKLQKLVREGKAQAPAKIKSKVDIKRGVARETRVDGYGRRDEYYCARIWLKGRLLNRRWSITKHGEDGARLAASLQKLLWVVENGLWTPADGDPLAITGYAESFAGNRDYENCVVTDVDSPWGPPNPYRSEL